LIESWGHAHLAAVDCHMKLRTRVLLTALISVNLLITIAFGVTAGHDILLRRADLASQASTLAAILARGLDDPLWQSHVQAVQDMIDGLARHPDFANATVMDEDGKVVASRTMSTSVQEGTLAADSAIVTQRNGRQWVLGSIEVQLTTKSLWTYGRRLVFALLATLVATSLAVAMAISLAFRLFTVPLDRVAAAAERLGHGDHDRAVPEQDRHDEIGNIARAIELSRRQMATIEQLRRDQDNYLQIVFANAVDGIILAGADGRIESLNPAAESIFGFSADAGRGQPLTTLLPGLELDAKATSLAAEIDGRRDDGSAIPLSVSISRFAFGDTSKLSVVVHDISLHKEAERTLIAARQAAEDANTTKSTFLANMSHEIRTPMNAIIGFTRLALDFELPPRLRSHMEKILTAAHGLLAIINDILDLSKIEVGKLAIEQTPFQLDKLLDELADIFTLRAHDQHLELLFDVAPDLPATLVGDPVRLRQVLVNLVGNALKFTEQGEIVVSARVTARDETGLATRFTVRDTGIGMTEQQAERVFQAFTQADVSTTRRYGGTGLGLTISRHIVTMMGGDIGVVSAPGEGSTFWFTARFGLPAPSAERPGRPAVALPDGLRVLVVDDNRTALDILSNTLASLRFTVQSAESASEALAVLEASTTGGRPVDVVLMDYLMPGMDGVEATRRIKQVTGQPRPPTVVMVTAYDRDDIAQQAWTAGVDAFLIKPVTPSQLLDTIQQVLGHEVGVRDMPTLAGDPAALSTARARLSGLRVLLVEDNDINRELAQEVLARSSLDLDTAFDGAEAIRMIKSGTYDAVLMDCHMPVMDGYTATRALRTDKRFDTLPIIAMTANAMAGDREECLAAGMNDYVAKPFDEATLLAVLARWTRRDLPSLPSFEREADSPPDQEGNGQAPPAFDSAQGLRRAGGDAALYQHLVERFAARYRHFAETYGAAQAVEDSEERARQVHTLKGLAATLGAQSLSAAAADLEKALRTPAAADREQPLLARLLAELDTILAEMDRSWSSASEPADAGAAGAAAPSAELAALVDSLTAGDVDSQDQLEALLERYPAMAASLQEVRRLVADYRFDEAATALDALMAESSEA
jgi:PAS domain S-box-containing protein